MEIDIAANIARELDHLKSINEDILLRRSIITELQKEQDSLTANIEILSNLIFINEEHIRIINDKLSEITCNIETINFKVEELEIRIADLLNQINSRILAIYKYGNINLFEAFLTSGSINELLSLVSYNRYFLLYEKDLLRESKDLYQRLQTERALLNKELLKERETLRIKRKTSQSLNTDISRKNDLIQKIETDLEYHQKYLQEIEKTSVEIGNFIMELENMFDDHVGDDLIDECEMQNENLYLTMALPDNGIVTDFQAFDDTEEGYTLNIPEQKEDETIQSGPGPVPDDTGTETGNGPESPQEEFVDILIDDEADPEDIPLEETGEINAGSLYLKEEKGPDEESDIKENGVEETHIPAEEHKSAEITEVGTIAETEEAEQADKTFETPVHQTESMEEIQKIEEDSIPDFSEIDDAGGDELIEEPGDKDTEVIDNDLITEEDGNEETATGPDQQQDAQSRLERMRALQARDFAGMRGRLIWPFEGRVSLRYGRIYNQRFNTYYFHNGIDIQAPHGSPVKSVYYGRVVYAAWYKGYGNLVIIDHNRGYYTLYGHLSEILVENETIVEEGDLIALSGDTGSLKGAVLYFEVRRNQNTYDPIEWLSRR